MKKSNILNENTKVIFEIDYDKLANTIIQANLSTNTKAKKKDSMRIKLMRMSNGTIYITLCLMAIWKIVSIWKIYLSQYVRTTNDFANNIFITILLGLITISLFLSQQESLDDKSEDVEKYFNTNIGLVALVLAIVALTV